MSLKKIFIFMALICSFSFTYAVTVTNTGAWDGQDADSEHVYDKQLSEAIIEFLGKEKCRSAVDFGCGMGEYVKAFNAAGIVTEGFDGNPYTVELTEGFGSVQDLSIPFDTGVRYDWVISLEVGEHIPYKYETNFIENVVRHAKNGVILSWAVKGQAGYGHVNCRNNPYIKSKMESYGFVNDEKAENKLRKKAFYPWFHNTVMVFRKK